MSLLGTPEWFFASKRKVPIMLVNAGLSLVDQTDQAVFADIDYGAPPHANRRIIVCVTAEESTSGAIGTVHPTTIGGVPMSFVERAGAGTGQVAIIVDIWEAIVPFGINGDLSIGLDKTASTTENFDSVGVSTLVTNMAAGPRLGGMGIVEFQDGVATANNLQTAGPGFIIGAGVGMDPASPFTSVVGNGSNGALTKLVDVNIANDHRHTIFLLDDTVASATEDYTINRGAADNWSMALASWSY